MKKLIEIYLAIPVTSCPAERSFSTLKRLETWLRSTIEQERLSSLTLINIERELANEIKIDNVLDAFATLKDRRMQFF